MEIYYFVPPFISPSFPSTFIPPSFVDAKAMSSSHNNLQSDIKATVEENGIQASDKNLVVSPLTTEQQESNLYLSINNKGLESSTFDKSLYNQNHSHSSKNKDRIKRLRNYSIGEAFNYHSNSINNENNNNNNNNNTINNNNFDIGGRSYVSMSYRPSVSAHISSPPVKTGVDIHQQTRSLANIGVIDGDDDLEEAFQNEDNHDNHSLTKPRPISSNTPLLTDERALYTIDSQREQEHDHLKQKISNTPDEEQQLQMQMQLHLHEPNRFRVDSLESFEKAPEPSKIHQLLVKPFQFLPAVFLGLLLNILDGLSYGMIMFPIGEAIFAKLAPAGLAMFYVSTITSQLIYSLGGSSFKSGIGSEMIEVTPFFHNMALAIAKQLASEGNDAIIATTITSFAVSSVITGLTFFALGYLKLGSLVQFFPRHILIGCIGGVGFFLVITGIEVSSRLEGGLFYNYETFQYLFYNHITLLQWTFPLGLAAGLVALQHRIHNSLLVPLYFIVVFFLFHIVVALIPSWNLQHARDVGWVFPAVEDDQPWYLFYALYKFDVVDWWCLFRQVPTMLALTFFGILHVPINVPALAITVGMDDIDVDRELVAHGYSNALSGLFGSVQNYLVYTNSVLFIRAGADDRLAGVMLAIATAAVMMAGPVVIGFIPVCVVGALIFLLGYELLKESVWDTWGRLRPIEYSTIIIIIVTMGMVDFVVGIGVGIILACVSYVVEAARTPVVQGIYSGDVARSTVLRHPKQQEFLKNVGEQICIVKLQGTIFFGSIGGVEKEIKTIFEIEKANKVPIKYLILDMKGVVSVDFSAAEGFRRILNLTNDYRTQLIISSVKDEDNIIKDLRDAGLFENSHKIELFNSLNSALEWAENQHLKTYKILKSKHGNDVSGASTGTGTGTGTGSSTGTSMQSATRARPAPIANATSVQSPSSFGARLFGHFGLGDYGTPRTKQVYHAAVKTVDSEHKLQSKYQVTQNDIFKKQPLPLLMITFQGLSQKDAEFWSPLAPFFIKEQVPEGIQLYDTNKDEPCLFILESGLIRNTVKFEEGRELDSSIVPLVAFGDLDEASQYRRFVYTTVNDSVVWKLSKSKIKEMLKANGSKGEAIYHELLEIEAKLIRERYDVLCSHLVLT